MGTFKTKIAETRRPTCIVWRVRSHQSSRGSSCNMSARNHICLLSKGLARRTTAFNIFMAEYAKQHAVGDWNKSVLMQNVHREWKRLPVAAKASASAYLT